MTYKSYSEQILEHLSFLKSKSFDVTELKVNMDFVRSCEVGKCHSRGELAYKTRTKVLNNGLTGLQTLFRGLQGEFGSFQTYGLGPTENEKIIHIDTAEKVDLQTLDTKYDEAGRKAYGFWQHSTITGTSAYLARKKVGSYGIRFRSNEQYGDVAVVPMFDAMGRFWNYQLLNSDGTKRQPKGARVEGLFHILGNLARGSSIGIAESYVTSASCLELTGTPTVCAFSCQNLKMVALILRKCYPESLLILFADNDRHLMGGAANQGLIKGQEALNALEGRAVMVTPDFGCSEASKGLTDWNDLIQHKSVEYARMQIQEKLKKALYPNLG